MNVTFQKLTPFGDAEDLCEMWCGDDEHLPMPGEAFHHDGVHFTVLARGWETYVRQNESPYRPASLKVKILVKPNDQVQLAREGLLKVA